MPKVRSTIFSQTELDKVLESGFSNEVQWARSGIIDPFGQELK